MKYMAHAKEGLLNLYFSKLRSILALLGVLVGTASVVAMILGGELATNEALREFKTLGTDLLAVSINATSQEKDHQGAGKVDHLALMQALQMVRADPAIAVAAPYTQLFYPIAYNGAAVSGMVLGVTDRFADIVHVKLQSGRFISLADQYGFYCVVGAEIYKAMKRTSYHEPLGQQLQIGKTIFVIVGVAAPWPENGFIYANIDNAILIPIMTSTVLSRYATINNIIMRLSPDASIATVEAHTTQYINRLLTNKQIMFRSAKELIAKMEKQSDVFTVFLGLIGGVSLIVGGIGVMNIMLVSVMERRREIGIRLAVGAKRFDIGALFLMEAIMLSLVGGGLGVGIGIGIAYLMTWVWGWPFIWFLWPPLVGFTVSVAVGVFFGFYPAYLASKLNPIEALRAE